MSRARRPIPVSSRDTAPICCGFLIVAMSVLRSPSRMPRLHSYRLSMSGASPMLNSAQSPTRQTTFTFGSPYLTVVDAQPYLLLSAVIRALFLTAGLGYFSAAKAFVTRFEGSMDCVGEFMEEDIVILRREKDCLVCVICRPVDAGSKSLVLDLHSELRNDLKEGRRVSRLVSGEVSSLGVLEAKDWDRHESHEDIGEFVLCLPGVIPRLPLHLLPHRS